MKRHVRLNIDSCSNTSPATLNLFKDKSEIEDYPAVRSQRQVPRNRDASDAAIMQAARPIAPDFRDAFLHVAAGLSRYPEVGPGVVHRVAAEAQKRFYDPPLPATGKRNGVGKYR